MAKTIIERNRWSARDVRNVCIRERYYTRGNNEAYSNMLNFVNENEPTKENILKVAADIMDHSDLTRYMTDYSHNEILANIMYNLKEKVITSYELIDADGHR